MHQSVQHSKHNRSTKSNTDTITVYVYVTCHTQPVQKLIVERIGQMVSISYTSKCNKHGNDLLMSYSTIH